MSYDISTANLSSANSKYMSGTGSLNSLVTARENLGETDNDILNSEIVNAFSPNASSSDIENAFNSATLLSQPTPTSDVSSLLKSSTSGTNLDSEYESMLSDLSKSSVPSTLTSSISNQSDMRLRIRPKIGISSIASSSALLKPLVITNGFVFPYKPRFNVRNAARYGTQNISHANQDFRYYIDTPSQSFDISGELTAQDTKQAQYMLATFHFFSLVTKMRFGTSDTNAGLPPPMMLLSGYGPYNFNDLPVIVESCSYNYPNDVDYVDFKINGVTNRVPSITTISINVTVQNTPDKLRSFNWDQFASGSLLSTGGWK